MKKTKKFDMQVEVKTVRFKLYAFLCTFTIAIILCLIILNNLVSENVYYYTKAYNLKNIVDIINSYYEDDDLTEYERNKKIREIETLNYLDIYIEEASGLIKYTSNDRISEEVKQDKRTLFAKSVQEVNGIKLKEALSKYKNGYILAESELRNGDIIYIKIQMGPIKENIKVANETIGMIGIALVILSAIGSSIFTKKIVQPINRIQTITGKMAKLDFSEKFDERINYSELREIGHNINVMSDKLERTLEQLRANNNELERKVEEKLKVDEMRKQFISDVSHELKTPIALIQGYSEGLIDNVNKDEESRKFYAEVIQDEAKKMDELVKKLLELMKLEYKEIKFNDTKFDLTKLINNEIRREIVVLQEKNITIDFDSDEINMVYADEDCIEQIISNFFTNAIKNCDEKNGEKKISIRTEKVNDKIRLYVYNTGNNIPKEIIKKIWGRFYKADTARTRENGGTGIGLALIKAIMNNYNNKYGVKNFPNGVEFYCDINSADKEQKE
nr:GHKL domain-containing protein [Clostridiales bacterium]